MNTATKPVSRVRRLMKETDDLHEELHALVDHFGAFKTIEHFAPWVEAQYLFQGQLLELYQNEDVAQMLPDAALRSRLQAAANDLRYLGRDAPDLPNTAVFPDIPLTEALAWLFVSEGSTLGAATLIKRAEALGLTAEHGASHLAAESPEARAASWRRFVGMVDALELTEEEDALMTAAAQQAFRSFAEILKRSFA